MSPAIERRAFLKAVALGCGGVALGYWLPSAADAQEEGGEFVPNAWIRITQDAVTIVVDRSEMGQGVMTSLPMLVAEELEVDLEDVRIEFAVSAPVYTNKLLGLHGTGGSSSVRAAWEPLRRAGATARAMLIAAAAKTWNVKPESCEVERGLVSHEWTGRSLSYGELAAVAATLPVPKDVPLKEAADYRLIGRPVKRLDTRSKVNGSAVFGIDFKVPGMLTASVLRSPTLGGSLVSFDSKAALAVSGVKHVVQIDAGVAVVATNYWAARKGREALTANWNAGPNAKLSSASIRAQFVAAAETEGAVAETLGSVTAGFEGSETTVEAVYEVPFLAHATMSPQNCTAHVRDDGADVWGPLQMQTLGQVAVATATGLDPSTVKVHTTLLGGGFGRRLENDFAVEAAVISKAVGAPVKVVWSREEDMQHSVYRPATFNRLRAGLDADGNPAAWTHRIVGQSIFKRVLPQFVKNGIDASSVEGAVDLPYAIPNRHVDYVMVDTPLGAAFWRSVGHSQNAFIVESFLDELADAAKEDPLAYRRRLLKNSPRHLAVLELAAKTAGWGTPLPEGRARGLAVHKSFESFAAQVVEASVSSAGEVRVHRVVTAIDCGQVVNPDTVAAQLQGGVVFGLTAALYGEITLENGAIQQSNFHDYKMLRMHEMPTIETCIVESSEPHGGVGEPGVPPTAPALANAIFAATGKRVRRLPIRPEDLR